MVKLIPAILTDSPDKLATMLRAAEKMADEVHVDFMDGDFVATVSVPPQSLIAADPKVAVEAHLMVRNPETFVAPFKETKVQRIIFHADAVDNCDFLIRLFTDEGFLVGLAINPETHVELVLEHLKEIKLVHFLTVKPGKQGNPFQGQVLKKIRALREAWSSGTISVDGGISNETIDQVIAAGADRIVVGSSIWQSHDPVKTYKELANKLS